MLFDFPINKNTLSFSFFISENSMMIFISNAFFKQFVIPSLRTEIISSGKFINPEGDSESSIAIMSKKSVKN
jgi:hypothetical protein